MLSNSPKVTSPPGKGQSQGWEWDSEKVLWTTPSLEFILKTVGSHLKKLHNWCCWQRRWIAVEESKVKEGGWWLWKSFCWEVRVGRCILSPRGSQSSSVQISKTAASQIHYDNPGKLLLQVSKSQISPRKTDSMKKVFSSLEAGEVGCVLGGLPPTFCHSPNWKAQAQTNLCNPLGVTIIANITNISSRYGDDKISRYHHHNSFRAFDFFEPGNSRAKL